MIFTGDADYLAQGLVDDELVKKHNLTPPGHGGTLRDASVIFKLAGQLKPAVSPTEMTRTAPSLIFLCRWKHFRSLATILLGSI